MRRIITFYFNSWWLPALSFFILLGGFTVTAILKWKPLVIAANLFLLATGLAFFGLAAASIWNFVRKQWGKGILNILMLFACGAATYLTFGFLVFSSMFGPSEDGFADNLKIPEGIDIVDPVPDASDATEVDATMRTDELQDMVRKALAVPGGDIAEFTPGMPSLRRAATDHAIAFRDYIESSPDWRVSMDRGNHFAASVVSHKRLELISHCFA
ncbi:MAG: hypothetical protein WCH99_10440, partial [Verrucomicrobiota bacterium]